MVSAEHTRDRTCSLAGWRNHACRLLFFSWRLWKETSHRWGSGPALQSRASLSPQLRWAWWCLTETWQMSRAGMISIFPVSMPNAHHLLGWLLSLWGACHSGLPHNKSSWDRSQLEGGSYPAAHPCTPLQGAGWTLRPWWHSWSSEQKPVLLFCCLILDVGIFGMVA